MKFFVGVAKARLALAWAGCFVCLALNVAELKAGQLYVGGATISITPDKPVALAGQMRTRIARSVQSPVTATALALETRDGDQIVEQAIFVSCELVAIRESVLSDLRKNLAGKLDGFDLSKLVLNATHTHTAPVTRDGQYQIPEDAIQPEEYRTFLTKRLTEVVTQAWQKRQPGKAGWGLGHAVVAYNRRAVYADGSAQMYGKTDRNDFRGIEGPEDQGIEILFFWDENDQLVATSINVASPAQIVEGLGVVNADYWHYVREMLQAKHGKEVLVLGWIGAAGDQVPRPMFRRQAEDRMRKLRGISQLEDIAGRISHAWEETYAAAAKEKHSQLIFKHLVETVSLSPRKISEADYQSAVQGYESVKDAEDGAWRKLWHQTVIDRYQQQQQGVFTPYQMELHVLRLGDVAIATNEFEYFTEFGIQIKARSKALQTFVTQLCGPGSYVPTQKAIDGGSYSAIAQSNQVGPEGGQELVERTLELINSLWK